MQEQKNVEIYSKVKAKHPEHILLFRSGDFYEMFFDDARICAETLGITLTSRGLDSKGKPIPLAGIPYHSVERYLAFLILSGHQVAIISDDDKPATFDKNWIGLADFPELATIRNPKFPDSTGTQSVLLPV